MASPLSSSGGRFRLRDLLPFGPGRHPRPRPFLEMAQVVWTNRDQLPYAWRILTRGVCDGCSLGPRGLRDDVIDGVHLCMTRLKLLRLNTMGPIPEDRLRDLGALRALSNPELHRLGRLPYPLVHRAGSTQLHRLSWDEALAIVAEELYSVPGDLRSALFGTRIMDDFFQVAVGGDIAFLNGALKHLIERDAWDREFVARRTAGFEAVRDFVAGLAWDEVERGSGLARADMARF